MSVEISLAKIIFGAFYAVMLILAFFIRSWMNKMQAEIDSVKNKCNALEKEFHSYQLDSAKEFAQKSEVNDSRKELMSELFNINKKIDHITDKLDKKADKP